jgi:flagellar hook assembly protein FlgD
MQLQQNYPNPFNPSTTIEFTLSRAEDVNLSIYNIQGMKIATLVSDRMNQGTHSVQFDGSGLASGVYYYQLSAGNMKNVKKMVLVK